MFQFLQAKHRDTYIHLAFKHWVSPSRVYAVAHGDHTRNKREKAVQQELVELGIMHRRHEHHHHHEADAPKAAAPATPQAPVSESAPASAPAASPSVEPEIRPAPSQE